MKVYIAGPMRGYPEFNHPAFNAAEQVLTEAGYEVCNPAAKDREEGFDWTGFDGTESLDERGFDIRKALAWDLNWIFENADVLAVLPGWDQSSGAKAEVAAARAIGIPVLSLEDLLR